MTLIDYALSVDYQTWRNEGARRLDQQAADVGTYERYYNNDIVSALISGESRDIFRLLLPRSRTNWSELVVDSVAERLKVVDFSFGASSQRAWQIWQGSNMDSRSEMVQTDALVCGYTYVSVWPDEENPTGVAISPEHPTQMVAWHRDRRGRRETIAAYKRVIEWPGAVVEQLLLPDRIVTWETPWPFDSETTLAGVMSARDPDYVEPNALGRVPVVELAPAPRTIGRPRSELHSVIPIQDRINLSIYNRMVASDFGAFRQITATGVELERDTDGGYRAPFNVGADRALVSENPDARFGVIPESDLRGYLAAVDADIQHLAAITKTPPHYLLGSMVNLSAQALKAAEAGLVAKVSRRAQHLGQNWEDVMRLALFAIGDDTGATQIDAETKWADWETRSEGERVDALVKMRTLDVPLEVLWEKWGESPQEIARWRAQIAAEAAQAATNQAIAGATTDPYRQMLASGQ